MAIRIDAVNLHWLTMPLVHFFETSFGRTYTRDIILVEVVSDGVSGWGEVTCGEHPFYNEEWTEGAWLLLREYVVPAGLGKSFTSAAEVGGWTAGMRGHKMTRGGFEAACWDLEARIQNVPLWKLVDGGARRAIPCGVSIGIQDTIPQLIEKIRTELDAGYQRIKVKIKPGWDVNAIAAIRKEFGNILLMGDANSAYTLADIDRLKELDQYELMMIEQPLSHDEIIDHAKLQDQLKTPICLDECIRSAHHVQQALDLDAGRIVNIKLGRVGGFAEAKKVHDICQQHGIPVWCGGMLEAGVGRAHNIALASLPNFTLPGDVSASRRYWKQDIISPWVETTPQGTIELNDNVGFGYDLDHDFMKSVLVRLETFRQQ